jgi:DNA (cytosine-5)-methyltransferase 1
MEPVFAADSWDEATDVYASLLKHKPKVMDLSDVVKTAGLVRRERVDLISGGPPCQDFSSAGKRTECRRANLTLSFADTVAAVRPTWFIMENVPLATHSKAYARARSRLSDAGYGLTEMTLNAAYFGVPQLRKRLFVVGRQDEHDGFLDSWLEDRATDKELTVSEYLGDEIDIDYYYRHPRVWEKRAIYSVDEPAATIRTVNRPIPANYRPHPNDAASPVGIRQLTPKERARVQTFPKSIKFHCSNTAADEMIGNAVPVSLAANVGRAIKEFEKMRGNEPGLDHFREWLSAQHQFNDRSAGNVLSRLKRTRKLLGGRRFEDYRDAAHELRKHKEYAELSVSVRSQLKRALELFSEFARQR